MAFVFAFWTGYSYKVIFDFSPNSPEIANSEEDSKSWVYGNAIGEYLQGLLEEQTVKWYEQHETQLTQIGLWAVPSLLPYPISEIIKRISEGDTVGARGLFVSYCTPAFLQGVMARWWDAPPFDDRRKLFEDAWHTHSEGRYGLSIHALVPQIEGIVADWVFSKLPPGESMTQGQASRTERLKSLVSEGKQLLYTDRRILEYLIDFIIHGPVLRPFWRWTDSIDPVFPSRHAVSHGRYDESVLTEEYSIKLFLLLDTLYEVLKY